MKKIPLILLVIAVFLNPVCKKKGDKADVTIAKKYSMFAISLKKDKNLKEKIRDVYLAKGEEIDLLDEIIVKGSNGKETEVSKIKLADDTIGYIKSKNIADSPIVFVEDVKAYLRPTSTSPEKALIPKGKLGFIISEKGSWYQVYVGELENKKWITEQWIESGYSVDKNLIRTALEFETAAENLASKDGAKSAKAKEKLQEIIDGSTIYSDMVKELLGKSGNSGEDTPMGDTKIEDVPDSKKSGEVITE